MDLEAPVSGANGHAERPPLTPEQARRGLFPKSLDDLQYRAQVFSIITAADAEYQRRKAKKAKR